MKNTIEKKIAVIALATLPMAKAAQTTNPQYLPNCIVQGRQKSIAQATLTAQEQREMIAYYQREMHRLRQESVARQQTDYQAYRQTLEDLVNSTSAQQDCLIQEHQQCIEGYQQQIAGLTEQITHLTSQVQEKDQRIQALERQADEVAADKKKMEDWLRKTEAEQEVFLVRYQQDEITRALKEGQQNVRHLKHLITDLVFQLQAEEHMVHAEKAKLANEEKQALLIRHEKEIAERTATLAREWETKLHEADRRHQQEMEALRSAACAEKDALIRERDTLAGKCQEASALCVDAHERHIASLKEQIAEIASQFDGQDRNIQTVDERLNNEVFSQEREAMLTRHQEDIAALTRQWEQRLQESYSQYRGDIDELNGQVSHMQNLFRQKQEEVALLKTQIAQNLSQLQERERGLEEQSRSLEEWQTRIENIWPKIPKSWLRRSM